jgi:phage terminase small subunit
LVKLATGNRGHHPLPKNEPMPDGDPVMPAWLNGRAVELWVELTRICFWLKQPDSYKLALWCERTAQLEDPMIRGAWTNIDRTEWRQMGSELGLDPISRARMGMVKRGTKAEDPAKKYFNVA